MEIVSLIKEKQKVIKNIVNIGIYVGFLAILIVCIHEKSNLHCDEVYTYVMSNNTTSEAITIAPDYYCIYEEPEDVWLDRMTVQEGEQFNFANVWAKQAQDNHPPLYYSLVHIISSFFPNMYSKWFAGSVNIVLGILTLHVLRLTVKKLTCREYPVFIVTCCFVFSAGVLSALTFFRMYVAAMFFVTLISYIFLRGVEKQDFKFYLALYLASIAGALTHYYFVVYLFFVVVVYGIWLILKKQWKCVGTLIGTMMLAGGTAILIFPAMLRHVFGGTVRGSQTMEQVANGSWSHFVYKFKTAYSIVDSQLFGGLFAILLIGVGITVIVKLILQKVKKPECVKRETGIENENWLIKWLLLWIPVVMYFITISKIAVFVTDRYFHPVYGLLILLVVSSMCVVLEKVLPVKWVFAVLLGISLFSTFREFGDNWFYLYRGTRPFLNAAAMYNDKDCIHVFNMPYEIDPAFYEISNYDRVVFVPMWDISGIEGLELNAEKGLILSIGTACDLESVKEKIQKAWPELTVYEEIGGHSFSVTYYFHK